MGDFYLLVLEYTTIVTLSFSLIFALGIIWRTEKKLDTTYKLVFGALLGFLASKGVGFVSFLSQEEKALMASSLELLAVFFLLLSILEMRDIVRILDHEVKNKK